MSIRTWMLSLAAMMFATAALAATVETDKADYAPGDTVYVIGTGWQPGETVALRFVEDPNVCEDRVFLATADANGDFFNADLVLEWHDFHVNFTLLATGTSSGLTAETTFTDAVLVNAISVSGDSISRAFDANTSLCNYGDNVTRVWATGDSHGTNFCGAGSEGTFSHAERLECAKGADITNFNDAASGANMRADFFNQASAIRTHLSASAGPRYVPVFMGHNDICTNTTTKTGNTCSGDQDPNNYCRTTTTAFEREFRRGMDQLIQIPSVRIIVEALARVSMLCTLGSKSSCGIGFGVSCNTFWSSGLFNVCKSLTIDCSNTRKIDAYNQAVAYNNILRTVTAEYAAIPTGGTSATGAVKASDVAIRFGEGVFNYKFQTGDLSCCDCFHPSDTGQQKLANFTYSGLQCSTTTPCCAPSTDALTNASCSLNDTTTFYPGGYWAGNPCGNGIVDPGEQCDLGSDNGSPGSCCTGGCLFVAGGTTCRAAADECDLPETCSGSSATCPGDAKKSAGAACTSDGNPCTVDQCDGTSNACQHPAGNAGAVCRPAAGACDLAETCTGGSATCPADAKSTAVCRPAAGVCDLAESCDGSSNDCPADAKSSAVCRPSAGVCDLAESCDGSSNDCPADAKSTAVCRASAGVCDLAESCDGSGNDCPPDAKSTVVCRPSAGVCDLTESCDGSSNDCPADAKSTAVCRPVAGVCDVAESCDGSSNDCPADGFQDASVVCRTAAGVCDVAESCTGSGPDCPADGKSTAVCRPAAGECDVADSCNGVSDDCPANAFKPASAGCTDDGNVCTDDLCDGAGSCVHPNNTAPCSDGNACTAPDVCSGGACVSGPPVYGFKGFFQPVDNMPVFNVGQAGQTYPIKWQLPLCAGGFVSRLDVVKYNPLRYRQIACDSYSPQDTLETVTSGNSVLRYDTTAQQYIYNWQTSKTFATKCYELLLELDNGSTQVARFRFPK